jgi:hypothetical protein
MILETSPHPYHLLPNSARNFYASRTPSPHLEFTGDNPYPGPSSVFSQAVYPPMCSPSTPLLSPSVPQLVQESQIQQINYQQVALSVNDNSSLPTNNIYVDMDTQQYLEHNPDLPVMWDVNLSENLSTNCTLEERTEDNMTDSFTILANTEINNLCQLSNNGPN